MKAITDVVAGLSKAPMPVLLLDTCSILDILRSVERHQTEILEHVESISNSVSSNPPDTHIAIAFQVHHEYELQAKRRYQDALTHLKRLNRDLADVRESSKLLKFSLPIDANLEIAVHLKGMADRVVKHAEKLDRDNDIVLKAYDREIKNIRPYRRGENKNDCIIIEEYLELCRQLRQRGFAERVIFLSSNTTDFCEVGCKTLHPDLVDDFEQIGLEYCFHWGQVACALGLTQEN